VPEYLCFYLNSLAALHIEKGSVGVALTHFNTKSVATMPLPLPPLFEQHRIVAKVDELMALGDRLERDLATTQLGSHRLLEATLNRSPESEPDGTGIAARTPLTRPLVSQPTTDKTKHR
jgi:type I restriction enzyme, S subunit